MSSEGSVSSNGSRIRQFGLYRSIDARTEEFLRLSRRRQIRQGCACAAVSTVITVTVVVVVICVYEFSLNSEVHIENSLRHNWLSLINDTTEDGFKTKYTKSDIDKTALTLLPILLKALKKNVFLEKILEEQSSSSPDYDGKETTEQSFEKNVFTRNWYRNPSSKFYSITYKTSPIDYYKSSSKNLEHFTKIRKIRDYQRIINYVDKMISERVYIRSTKPMMKGETYSEKPLTKIVTITETKSKYKKKHVTPKKPTPKPIPKPKPKPKLKEPFPKNINTIKENIPIKCKCPIKIGKVLRSILSGVEKLLSIATNKETNIINICNHTESPYKSIDSTSAHPKTHRNILYTYVESTSKTNEEDENNMQQHTLNKLNDNNITFQELSQNITKNVDDFKNLENFTLNKGEGNISTTNDMKIMTSVSKFKNVLNQIFEQNSDVMNEKISSSESIGDNRYKEQLSTTEAQYFFTNSDDLEIDNKKDNSHVEKFRQDLFDNRKKITYKPSSYKKLKLVGENTSTKGHWLKNLNNAMYQIVGPDNTQMKPITTETTLKLPKMKLKNNIEPGLSDITNSNDSYPNTKETKKNKKNMLSTTVEEDADLSSNLTQEDQIKQIELYMDPPLEANVSITKIIDKTKTLWEELKNENVPAWKSMMPNTRPVYLEIQQRNDWKHEEEDYDFNILNTYDSVLDVK